MASTHAIEKRSDPQSLLPGCQSIVVVGMNCLPLQSPSAPEARIAAYAQGDDYHSTMEARLQSLVDFIQGQITGTCGYKIYVDTGPILERELAQRAGLGWIGKNTCLIHPQFGSHFLLGELLLSLRLPVDPPFKTDHCGSCTRCIVECPTDCILPNRTIDAKRCISYLTIENRGDIPSELRPAMDNWVFGCDICQDVCPWNRRFSTPTEEVAFQPRPFLEDPDLKSLLLLSPRTYQAELRASPLKRPKRIGLIRNAAVAAGNSKRENLIPFLEVLILEEEDDIVRSHALWALGQIGGEKSKAVLETAKAKLQDPELLMQIQMILESDPPRGESKTLPQV